MATTERMGVDPLAFLDSLHVTDADGAVTNRKWPEAQDARAAVAELAVAGKRVTDAFRAIGENRLAVVPGKLRVEAELAMLALDAALAAFSEAQS